MRLELPTILGELLAGVIIGASGLHLLVPPETQVQLSGAFADVIAGMAHIPCCGSIGFVQREFWGAPICGHSWPLLPVVPNGSGK